MVGPVRYVNVPHARTGALNQGSGIAFVEFYDRATQAKALKLDGSTLLGKIITVKSREQHSQEQSSARQTAMFNPMMMMAQPFGGGRGAGRAGRGANTWGRGGAHAHANASAGGGAPAKAFAPGANKWVRPGAEGGVGME